MIEMSVDREYLDKRFGEVIDRIEDIHLRLKRREDQDQIFGGVRYFSSREVSNALEIDIRTLQRYCKVGSIEYQYIGTKRRFTLAQISDFLEKKSKKLKKE